MNAVAHQANGKAHRAPVAAVNEIALSLIHESPTNPRKTFTEIEELAADIKQHGVLQHVLVRPHPSKAGGYELVFGARRFRAAKLAKLADIPAVVRELDDAKVLELQIVENSQRADIHPLEEADGYHALHTTHGYAVEDIAAKVGKSVSAVYARLKLCALVPEARAAFLEGKITAGTALVVARIPHDDLQRKALEEVGKPSWNGEPVSAREASRTVQQRYMLRLVDAPFDRAAAPGCAACPKRTGNQRELFSDVETKDDLCTDPKCFKAKSDAAWTQRTEEAKTKGQAVLSAKEAKQVFGAYGSTFVPATSGFVDLAAKVYDEKGREKTNRSLLGKAEIPVVLARDPNGGIRELVDAKAFAKATKQPTPKAAPAATIASEQAEATKKKRERERAKHTAEVVALVGSAERREPTDAFWRTLAIAVAQLQDFDHADILERRALLTNDNGEDLEKVTRDAVAKMTGGQARGLVVELLAGDGYASDKILAEFHALYGAKGKAKPAAKKAASKAKPAPKKKAKAKAKR